MIVEVKLIWMCDMFSLNIVILHTGAGRGAGGGWPMTSDTRHNMLAGGGAAQGGAGYSSNIIIIITMLTKPSIYCVPPDTPELSTLRSPLQPRPRPAQADRQLAASSGRAELGRARLQRRGWSLTRPQSAEDREPRHQPHQPLTQHSRHHGQVSPQDYLIKYV